MRKKVLLIVTVLLLITNSIAFASPSTNPTSIEKQILSQMTDEQQDYYQKFKENGGELTPLSEENKNKVEAELRNHDTVQNFEKEELKDFESVELESEQTSFEITDDGGTIYSYFETFVNKESGTYIVTTTVYNGNREALISYNAEKYESGGNNSAGIESIMEYNTLQQTNAGGIAPMDFEWSGKTFVCGMAGIFLCLQYCLIWGAVHFGAGIACGIACDIAFVIGCM